MSWSSLPKEEEKSGIFSTPVFPTEHLFFPHTASTSHFLVQTLIISPKTKKEFRPHLLPKRQVGPTCITDSLSPQRAVVSPPVRMLASPLQVSQIPSPICGPAPTVSRPRTPGSNPPTPRAPSPTAWTHPGGAHRQWEMGRGAPTWEQRGFSGLPVAARLNNGHPFPPLSQNSPKRAASPLLLPNPYASRTFSKLPLPPPSAPMAKEPMRVLVTGAAGTDGVALASLPPRSLGLPTRSRAGGGGSDLAADPRRSSGGFRVWWL